MPRQLTLRSSLLIQNNKFSIICWSRQDNSHCSFEYEAYEPLYTRDTELIQD